MASPAEVANDMAAQAAFWVKRDKKIGLACADAATIIRKFLNEDRVDGRTYFGLRRRLLDLSVNRYYGSFGIVRNLDRALRTLQVLHGKAVEK